MYLIDSILKYLLPGKEPARPTPALREERSNRAALAEAADRRIHRDILAAQKEIAVAYQEFPALRGLYAIEARREAQRLNEATRRDKKRHLVELAVRAGIIPPIERASHMHSSLSREIPTIYAAETYAVPAPTPPRASVHPSTHYDARGKTRTRHEETLVDMLT